jgi:guanylate kinase
MKREGVIIIISAPSGAGKTTLCSGLLRRFPDMLESISYTTRAPRSGEVYGEHYYFVSEAEFRRMIAANMFAEWAEVHGNLYGTALQTLEESRKNGIDIVLDIDCQGARQLKDKSVAGSYVFILPPSMTELRHRLENRSSDAPEVIERRIVRAADEIKESCWYDYLIINDNLEKALDELTAIVTSEGCRTFRMQEHVAKLFDICCKVE